MNTFALRRQLKQDMKDKGLDSDLLDDPDAIIPNQPGSTLDIIKNDRYEKGLRYCLDTNCDPSDWRRKTYETCYQCPSFKLKSVCLSCARHCLFDQKLIPYIRQRIAEPKKRGSVFREQTEEETLELDKVDNSSILPGNACDCVLSGKCVCSWSTIRAIFDSIANPEDNCVAPNQVRVLLQSLRAPAPVDNADVEECLMTLAEGIEQADFPRLNPVKFEMWYREFYQEIGDERTRLLKQIYDQQMAKKR